MSYFTILLIFTSPPLLGLLLWAIWDAWRGVHNGPLKRFGLALLLHIGLAVLYTTPWDNYMVKEGIWWYDPALITGIKLGWVPIEEYTFFVVQTLLAGFSVITAARYIRSVPVDTFPVRQVSIVSGLLFLLVSAVFVLASALADWKQGTYLALLLPWALPPIWIQLSFGADILWARRKLLTVSILGITLYACILDSFAMHWGTWIVDPAQSSGWVLGGVLPVEELLFYLLVDVMVAFGIVLLMAEESQVRLCSLLQRFRRVGLTLSDECS